MVSIVLASFSIGGIFTQVPIDIVGDKIGRRKVILIATICGTCLFTVGGQFENSGTFVAGVFLLAGMFLGSLFFRNYVYG